MLLCQLIEMIKNRDDLINKFFANKSDCYNKNGNH